MIKLHLLILFISVISAASLQARTEKYFTEDAFKSLVDQFNKLYDEVED